MVGAGGTVYVGSYDNKLYAINSDGSLKWSYLTGDGVGSSPAIGIDETVYVGSLDGKLYAINQDGSLRWSFTTGWEVHSSPAIGADGTVYVGSGDNKLYAINPDGSLKWSYTTGSAVQSSPAIGADGTAYVGSLDNKLYAINPDGTLKWSYTTGDDVYSSPAIGADGTVYVGSYDNKFYAINSDGSLKWSYTTGSLMYSSPAIGEDGTVYVGCEDGKLYAFGPGGGSNGIEITSLTTDKTTHYGDGGDGVASNLTVVANPTPDSVEWSCTVGEVTGSGTSVTYTPPAGSAAGVCVITCTVYEGADQDSGTIKMYLTNETIKTAWQGRDGSNHPLGDPPNSGYKVDFTYNDKEYVQPLEFGHGVVPGSGSFYNQSDGKVVLLSRWELWSAPDRAELPELDNFGEHFKDFGFLFIAGSSGTNPAYNANAINIWFIDNNIDFCHDYHGSMPDVWDMYGADGYIPMNLVIDRDGYIRWIGGNAEAKAPLIQELTGGPAY